MQNVLESGLEDNLSDLFLQLDSEQIRRKIATRLQQPTARRPFELCLQALSNQEDELR